MQQMEGEEVSMKNGGPAFPFTVPTDDLGFPDNGTTFTGMTLRDYFAAMAMNGFCGLQDHKGEWRWDPEGAAERAYEVADAMLKAREAT
jgi:hypothetical protein